MRARAQANLPRPEEFRPCCGLGRVSTKTSLEIWARRALLQPALDRCVARRSAGRTRANQS
eukprot:11097428-Alexandrium_andersonii.AAC.1